MSAPLKQKFEIETDLKKNPNDPRYSFGRPNKAKSDVWKRFSIVKYNGKAQNYARCHDCSDILTYSGVCGTGSLLRHKCIKKRHFKTEQKGETPNKLLPEYIRDQLIKAQIEFLVKDFQPPSSLEGEGFKELAQALIQIGVTYGKRNIGDVLLSGQAITQRHMQNEFNLIKSDLKSILQNNNLAFSLDIWTDSRTQKSFITLCTHFIDENFKVKSYILGTREYFKDTQSGKNIYVLVEEILSEYSIEHKLVESVIVTANESNVVAAFENFQRLSCACHSLNLVMTDVLESEKNPELHQLIDSSKKLVSYFKESDLNSQLSKALIDNDKPCWSSLFNMFESIYDMQQEIYQMLFERNELRLISGINYNLLTKVVEFLIPFQSCSEKLSCDIAPTIHEYFLWYQKLKNHCRTNSSDPKIIEELKQRTIEALNSKFKPSRIHNLALFLNPPYKRLQFLDETQREHVMETVQTMLEDAFKCIKDEIVTDQQLENDIKMSESEYDFNLDELPSSSKKLKYNSFEEFKDPVISNRSQSLKDIELEIKAYLRLVVDDDYSDVQSFWKETTDLPLLRDLSRQILNIPASSTTSEKVFSKHHQNLAAKRIQLLEENVDMFLFLNKNMKSLS